MSHICKNSNQLGRDYLLSGTWRRRFRGWGGGHLGEDLGEDFEEDFEEEGCSSSSSSHWLWVNVLQPRRLSGEKLLLSPSNISPHLHLPPHPPLTYSGTLTHVHCAQPPCALPFCLAESFGALPSALQCVCNPCNPFADMRQGPFLVLFFKPKLQLTTLEPL